MVKEKEMNKTFSTLGFFSLFHEILDNLVSVSCQGSLSGRSNGALLEDTFPRLQSSAPLFTCPLWELAGHWDAAAMDEEQMLGQTKVSMAWRG